MRGVVRRFERRECAVEVNPYTICIDVLALPREPHRAVQRFACHARTRRLHPRIRLSIVYMLPAAAQSALLCVFSTALYTSFDAFQATFVEGHPNSFNANESRLCLGIEVQAARLHKYDASPG